MNRRVIEVGIVATAVVEIVLAAIWWNWWDSLLVAAGCFLLCMVFQFLGDLFIDAPGYVKRRWQRRRQ